MQNDGQIAPDRRSWIAPVLAIAILATGFRVVLLAFNRTDLFVDEAQYWLWGQELAFGYYSKPPLIGWVIRASTELGGSDAAFWVRLPAPILHGITSIGLAALAARLFGGAAAVWVAATYVTLPMVTVGSLLVSTDTIMVPFLVLALYAWFRALDRDGATGWALLAGAALGVGFLAKYAAIYMVICAGLAALLLPRARPGWRPALAALAGFAVAISPNVIWNLQNGLSTLEHTLDNADWVRDPGDRADLSVAGLAEFLGTQFFVFGPILFATLLWLFARWRRNDPDLGLLTLFSLPILAIVSTQALLSEAYPNWAATAYLAGTLAVVPVLLRGRRWLLRGSLGLHLLLAVLLPLATVIGTGWRAGPDGPLLLERYLGRADLSAEILQAAREADVDVVVAGNRDILADLFYRARGSEIAVFARPEAGRAPNHYVLMHSLPSDMDGQVLFVSKRNIFDADCPATLLGRLEPSDGAYAGQGRSLFLVPAHCLQLDR